MSDLIPARDADLPEIERFLAQHAETSMFLRGNLALHGLGDTRSPRAVALRLTREGGRLTGVFGLTNAGFALVQAPEAEPAHWALFADWLRSRGMMGLTGATAQVQAAVAALDLPPESFGHVADEPLYRLDLADLRLDTLAPGQIRRPRDRDRALLTGWFTDYEANALGTPPDRAAENGAERADNAIDGDRVRLLEHEDTPLAMTAFNAVLPDIVQVGGVYTPPTLRRRHAARTAVAHHLREARHDGVRRAVLFAASPEACRAYEALGFRRIGRYTLALLKSPLEARNG